MILMVLAAICAFCCSSYIYNIIRDNILRQHNSKGSWSSYPFDCWEEIQSLKWQTFSSLESNCFIGFIFIPLMIYFRKVMAPYLSSGINICGFFNERFATLSPFPSEGTSTRGGGGVALIHSHPPFWVCISSDVLARSSFQGQRFPAQGIFLFTQIILLREMPCCDSKWEENKAGDLINEVPVDVGMRGQIRHKSKITQLNLGAERASQSVMILACVSFPRLAS